MLLTARVQQELWPATFSTAATVTAPAAMMKALVQARFTMGEAAVLAVIGAEVRTKGACTLTNGHLAALAGVSVSTVKNALRAAYVAGVIRVEERRVSAVRNLPNRITITEARPIGRIGYR